jgi:hypothetical protein
MGLNPYSLGENILNKLPKAYRKEKGIQTKAEATAKNALRLERDEQRDFANLLAQARGRRELTYDWKRTDKASTGVVGRPDFEVNLPGQTVFFEFKTERGILSDAQRAERSLLEFLGYKYYVVYSAKQAYEILSDISGRKASAPA